jgi:uncharacterized protein YigE (DUF2233 family)
MTKLLCVSLLWLTSSSMFGADQTQWKTLRPGLETLTSSFMDHEKTVTFMAVRCDPKSYRIRIINTLRAIASTNAFAAYSIKEISKATRALVVVNAGSTGSYSLPAPVGLLITDGMVVNPATPVKDGGILCVNGDHVAITPIMPKASLKCSDAVQRGPLLPNGPPVQDAKGRYRRTVSAIDDKGRLLVLVTNENTTLAAVTALLYNPRLNLATQAALNLDGDTSSGMLLTTDTTRTKSIAIGNIDGLIASAIAIIDRKQP